MGYLAFRITGGVFAIPILRAIGRASGRTSTSSGRRPVAGTRVMTGRSNCIGRPHSAVSSRPLYRQTRQRPAHGAKVRQLWPVRTARIFRRQRQHHQAADDLRPSSLQNADIEMTRMQLSTGPMASTPYLVASPDLVPFGFVASSASYHRMIVETVRMQLI